MEGGLRTDPVPVEVYGATGIEPGALDQMRTAARLPIAAAGALMPDAHLGYGLPIGGVLAVRGAVIPYGVGVDIGCRMCLSVFDLPVKDLEARRSIFKKILKTETRFGSGKEWERPEDAAVLARAEFRELSVLRPLKDKAWRQLGTSGSGNHFVEFGEVELLQTDPAIGLPTGRYLGLLSHSGSRALGAAVANKYTALARNKALLEGEAAHLSWLSLEEEAGIEYWKAMNLAGDYASACHHSIHRRIATALGRQPVARVENHHNFAWKEVWKGEEVIVHRKGATPAGKGVLGVIPGSMTAPGYIVRGRGAEASISSASHGAGRRMSRSQALKTLSSSELDSYLSRHGVTLIGGGLDEAPMAYKDIWGVMQAQAELVETVGTFQPRVVRMDGK